MWLSCFTYTGLHQVLCIHFWACKSTYQIKLNTFIVIFRGINKELLTNFYHSSGLGYVVCLRELSGSYSNATPAVGFHLACSLAKP